MKSMLDPKILSKKVLILDDMDTIRVAMLKTLQKLGFTNITQAVDGLQGLERVKENSTQPFDLIFSDIMMPKCTGIEFLRQLRCIELYKTTPVIMVTSENELTTIVDAIDAGANSYLLKPFNEKSIEQKVTEVFTRKK